MPIETAQVPMGPDAERAIRELLAGHLDPSSASFEEVVRQVAGRVDQDAGRLPWSSAMLAWLSGHDRVVTERTVDLLRSAAADVRAHVARGAALLLTAIADGAPGAYDDLLFSLTADAKESATRQLLGAYLLATPRTWARALAELAAVPGLSPMIERQVRVQGSLESWRRLVQELGSARDSPYGAIFLDQLESHPDLHFDLQNGYLDVFDGADAAERRRMARLLLEILGEQREAAQLFVCDLLTYPPVLEAARRGSGYRLARLLQRLEQDKETPPRVRQYAGTLLAMLETSAGAEDWDMAARGRLDKLASADRALINEALNQAREWFATQSLGGFVDLQASLAWDVTDYAHAALLLLGGDPGFPVPLEALCRRVGIFLQGVRLAGELDGLLIQQPTLPGPVVLFNLSVSSESRRRFTVAHEVAHALLPWHAEHNVFLSKIVEAATDPHVDEAEREVAAAAESGLRTYLKYEREADRFAAALLMPPRWFGPAVRQRPFTMQGLDALSKQFGVSLTAAAFQAIHYTREAVAIVYSEQGRVRFQRMTDEFREQAGVEANLLHRLRPETAAASLLVDPSGPASRAVQLPASLWFSSTNLAEVREESLRTAAGHVLSILAVVDEA